MVVRWNWQPSMIGVGLVGGFWGLAVIALGMLPAAPAPVVTRSTGTSAEAESWEHTYQWSVTRSLPCLDQRLTLTLGLTLQTETASYGEFVDVTGLARLAVLESEPYHLTTSPILSRFAFTSPSYGGPGNVHEVRAALAGVPDVVTIAVGVVQGTDSGGRLIVQPGQVTMTCR